MFIVKGRCGRNVTGGDMENNYEGDEFSPVSNRWAEIESRLDDIQHHIRLEETSLRKKLSEWGGMIALFLSILIGGYTVFENLVLADKRQRAEDLRQLREIVVEIGKLNVEAVSDFPQTEAAGKRGGPSDVSSQDLGMLAQASKGQAINNIKLPLMDRAVSIIEEHKEYVDPATVLVIVQELYNAQDLLQAQEMGFLAMSLAKRGSPLYSEAARISASTFAAESSVESIAEARKLYAQAISSAKEVKNINAPWLLSNSIRDWSLMEALIGNCPGSLKAYKMLFEELDGSGVEKVARTVGASAVVNQIGFYGMCNIQDYMVLAGR